MTSGGAQMEYVVRRRSGVTQMRVTVSPRHGVVVTAAPDATAEQIVAAIDVRRAWIDEALEHFAEARQIWIADPLTLLPGEVCLEATGEGFSVAYLDTEARGVRVVRHGRELRVSGDVADGMACLRALQRWLQRHATAVLLPWLDTLASEAGVPVAGRGVRGQYARWGGCSQRGFITLNRALLFLREELVRAVMLHELAHLTHPDHSPAFWMRLAQLDPASEEHRDAIASAWDRIPAWAERR